MSNTQPLPDAATPAKPAGTVERLTRIETLLLLLYKRVLIVECLSVAVLVALAFVLGHVWR